MGITRDERITDAGLLRRRLCEAQAGCEVAYRAVLHWAAERADGNGDVGSTLMLLHRLRHTYHPSGCPEAWLAAIIAAAARGGDATARRAARVTARAGAAKR